MRKVGYFSEFSQPFLQHFPQSFKIQSSCSYIISKELFPPWKFRNISRDNAHVHGNIPSVRHLSDDQQVVTEYAGLSFNDANVKHVLVGQMFQNVEKPMGEQDSPTAFGKTMTDHQLMTGTYLDTSPYVVGYYSSGDQNANQPPSHEITYEIMKRPENGMLVLQHEESTYTRKRKFPYQFYQPSSEYHNVKYAEVLQHPTVAYPQVRKWVSNVADVFTVTGLPL